MDVQVAKDAIDLGIVTTNGDAMLTFYRDVLGFQHEGDIVGWVFQSVEIKAYGQQPSPCDV